MIAALIAAGVGLATFEFYQAQHELYMAQVDIVERQGNLRFAADDLSRVIRRSGYGVKGGDIVYVSATFDTLEVYRGNDSDLTVDTIRYYINRFDNPPSLIKQLNQATPSIFAVGIDSIAFVPAGGPPVDRIAVSMVSVEQKHFENTALTTRKRLGRTINLRNQ